MELFRLTCLKNVKRDVRNLGDGVGWEITRFTYGWYIFYMRKMFLDNFNFYFWFKLFLEQ